MEIELPNGTVLDAPDDADVKKVVQGYYRSINGDDVPVEQPNFMARMGRGFMDVGQGVKQLALQASDAFTGKDDADEYRRQVNDELELYDRGRAAAGGGIDWGRIAGGVAATAPLGAGVALPATLAGRVALGAGLGATAGGLQYAREDGDRTRNIVGGAVVGGAVPVGGQILRRTLGGLVPKTPEAAQMLKEGVPLTPGQMRGGAAQTIEQALSKLPIVGPAVRARQMEALSAWNRNLINDARPGVQSIAQGGQQGIRELTKQFSDAYEALWNKSIPLKDGTTVHGKLIERLDDTLRKEGADAARRGERQLAEQASAQRSALRSLLPDDVSTELSRLDKLYVQFSTLRRAGGYVGAAQRGGTFTPAQLLGASRAADRSAGKGATARGQAPLQQQARNASEVFGPTAGPQAGVLERAVLSPVGAAARPLYSLSLQSWMRGESSAQKWATKVTEGKAKALIDYLRRSSSPSMVEVTDSGID